jgi:hypothetical protein
MKHFILWYVVAVLFGVHIYIQYEYLIRMDLGERFFILDAFFNLFALAIVSALPAALISFLKFGKTGYGQKFMIVFPGMMCVLLIVLIITYGRLLLQFNYSTIHRTAIQLI